MTLYTANVVKDGRTFDMHLHQNGSEDWLNGFVIVTWPFDETHNIAYNYFIKIKPNEGFMASKTVEIQPANIDAVELDPSSGQLEAIKDDLINVLESRESVNQEDIEELEGILASAFGPDYLTVDGEYIDTDLTFMLPIILSHGSVNKIVQKSLQISSDENIQIVRSIRELGPLCDKELVAKTGGFTFNSQLAIQKHQKMPDYQVYTEEFVIRDSLRFFKTETSYDTGSLFYDADAVAAATAQTGRSVMELMAGQFARPRAVGTEKDQEFLDLLVRVVEQERQ